MTDKEFEIILLAMIVYCVVVVACVTYARYNYHLQSNTATFTKTENE